MGNQWHMSVDPDGGQTWPTLNLKPELWGGHVALGEVEIVAYRPNNNFTNFLDRNLAGLPLASFAGYMENELQGLKDFTNTVKDFQDKLKNASDDALSKIGQAAKRLIPDNITISFLGQSAGGVFGGEELNFTLITNGNDRGLYFNTSTTFGVTSSIGVDGGISFGTAYTVGAPTAAGLGGWQLSIEATGGGKLGFGGAFGSATDIGFGNGKISSFGAKGVLSGGVGVSTPFIQGTVELGYGTNAIPLFKF
jgi:hypothetical protein